MQNGNNPYILHCWAKIPIVLGEMAHIQFWSGGAKWQGIPLTF
jgi:hypothetical protein